MCRIEIPRVDDGTVRMYRSPENAAVKQKMIYTSSKDTLKRALVGIGKDVQACDYGDLAWSNILEVLLRTETAQ